MKSNSSDRSCLTAINTSPMQAAIGSISKNRVLFAALTISSCFFGNVGQALSNVRESAPNCGGLCVYANIQTNSSGKSNSSSSSNSTDSMANIMNGLNSSTSSQMDVSVGFMWQIISPDQTNLDTQKTVAIAQIAKTEDEQKFLWMEKLTEAVNANNMAQAHGIAILLAPKLGKTAEQLMSEVILAAKLSPKKNDAPVATKPNPKKNDDPVAAKLSPKKNDDPMVAKPNPQQSDVILASKVNPQKDVKKAN